MTNEGVCLDAAEELNQMKNATVARIVTCADSVRQYWLYDIQSQQIRQRISGNCLTVDSDIRTAFDAQNVGSAASANGQPHENTIAVSLTPCTENQLQKWILLPHAWK